MHKFCYVLLSVILSTVVAQGQTQAAQATPQCADLRYPVNRFTNRPPALPSGLHPQQNVVVGVSLTVDKEGKVKDAVVVISGGKEIDDIVLKTMRTWTYLPARCGPTPIEMTILVKLNLQFGQQHQ